MISFLKTLSAQNRPQPSPPVIFFTVALTALLQLPINWLISSFNLTLGLILNEVLILAGLPFLVIFIFGCRRKTIFPLTRPHPVQWLLLLGLAFGAVIAMDYLTAASHFVFPLPEKYRRFLEELMHVGSLKELVGKSLLICLLPGICEEIFFRGFCQTALARHFGNTKAILVTALFFAVLHGNVWHLHLYFLLSCLLGFSYLAGRTLLLPMALHILNNAWNFAAHLLGWRFPIIYAHDPLDLFLFFGSLALAWTAGWLLWKEGKK